MAEDRSLICISSSPEFPSLLELIAKRPKKPALRTGSNAAPISDDASTTFSTAASMWRASQSVAREAERPGIKPLATANSTAGIALDSSPLLAPVELPLEVPKKKPRATKATVATRKKKTGTEIPTETGDGPTSDVAPGAPIAATAKAKPAPRKRVAKAAADGQTTLPKGRVTKPAGKPAAKRKVSANKTESVSRHFSKEPSVPKDSPEARPGPVEHAPFDLEPATRRRTDWTPPPDDFSIVDNSSAVKEMTSTAAALKEASGDLFKTLQETFGRKEEEQNDGGPSTAADVLGKRKLLQMFTATTTSESTSKSTTPEVSPAKSKVPKKKPRTITDLAMEAYIVADESETIVPPEAPKQGSIVGYLDGEGVAAESAGGKKAAKKPAKPRASRKKPEPKKPILLSPSSAMRQVSRQDFVFGTASQLATEEDPELLRALHEAMKASNLPDDDLFQSSSPFATDLSLRRRGLNKLWVAGARDDDGDLLDIEVIDMTESPVVPNPFATLLPEALPALPKHKEQEASPPRGSQHVPIELSSDFFSFDDTPLPKSHFFTTQVAVADATLATQPTTPAPSLRYNLPGSASVTADFDLEPPPSNQEHNMILSQSQSVVSPKPMAAAKGKGKAVVKRTAPKAKELPELPEQAAEEATDVAVEQVAMGPPPPKYELFTDAQLSKEITSYGFKAVKKRTAMIELLQQCWSHKHKMPFPVASATAAINSASASVPTPASPKPRGRPKKVVTATKTADAVEPVQPAKKPRGRPRKDAAATSPSKPATTKAKATAASSKAAKSAASAAPETMEPPAPATPKRRKPAAKAVVEIPDSGDSDSESDAFGSPMVSPERRDDIFSSPARGDLELSITEDTEMSLLVGSPSTREMEVFDYITKAIMTEPPTTDVTEPSWHEKMLMYDPVILEDLAAWLNLGQLDRVGYDGEVAASEVKSWCESKSICCLWRVNLKGRERKRL